MIQNRKNKSQDFTLKSLKAQLRNLPVLRTADSLKQKVLAAIPNDTTELSRKRRPKCWTGPWGLGAAAAAVFIGAVIFMANYVPSTSSTILAELNDASSGYVLFDQNSSRAEVNKPAQLLWQIAGQNEP